MTPVGVRMMRRDAAVGRRFARLGRRSHGARDRARERRRCTTTSSFERGPRPPAPQRERDHVRHGAAAGAARWAARRASDTGEGDGTDAPTRRAVTRAERRRAARADGAAAGGTPGGVDGTARAPAARSRRRRPASCPPLPDPRLARRRERSSHPAYKTHGAAQRQRREGDDLRVQRLRRSRPRRTRGSAARRLDVREATGRSRASTAARSISGKFTIPSAVLAALPIRVQGNPGETIADRLVDDAPRRHAAARASRSSTTTSSRPP